MVSGIFLAFLAQIFIAASLITDKILLGERTKGRILTYVFWIGILNLFGILIFPLGFTAPSIKTVLFSFAAGLVFFLTLLAYYTALSHGSASRTLPIIGAFAPIATYGASGLFSITPLNVAEKMAFILLTLGGLLLMFSEKINYKKVIFWSLLAAALTGLGDVLQKLAFSSSNFTTGFVLMKFATFAVALLLLSVPAWRKNIFAFSSSAPTKHRWIYFINRLIASLSAFLIFYAIALEPQPALIESINSVHFALLFLLAFGITKFKPAWLKENFKGWVLAAKILAVILITFGLAGLDIQKHYASEPVPSDKEITWGVTFSEQMSKHFGLDWKKNFDVILTDLKPQGLRLIAYWDDIERRQGEYNFMDLDWQMNEAKKSGVPVVLVVGQRVPRWPECHFPSWINTADKSDSAHQALFQYIQKVIERYKDFSNLKLWQAENEPFLIFGECPKADTALIDQELALVRNLDPAHKILLTDGGEFGDWYRASKRADVFAPTLYRKVHTRLFGYITWPLTPQFYPLHRDMTRFLTGKLGQEYWISELGLEPWMIKQIYEVDIPTQLSFFDTEDFKNVITYARQTGFTTFYAWGAEWWYYMKQNNDPRFWNMAKEVFQYGKVR